MPVKSTTKPLIKQRPAPGRLIKEWARTICANGDDATGHTAAFLLLLDEIARQYNWIQLEEIVDLAKSAAFCGSNQADNALNELVNTLRAQKGLRVIKGGL